MKYECHVTTNYIEPDTDDHALLTKTARLFGFRVAKLYKTNQETSDLDTFMTGHDDDLVMMKYRMKNLCYNLGVQGFDVLRYKIEEIILDSRNGDLLDS